MDVNKLMSKFRMMKHLTVPLMEGRSGKPVLLRKGKHGVRYSNKDINFIRDQIKGGKFHSLPSMSTSSSFFFFFQINVN